MNKIKISAVKKIRENLNLTQLIIIGIDADSIQHVATHGKTKYDAKIAADLGNVIKSNLGWPPSLCNTKPLIRECENCSFWQRKRIDHSERIPENWPGNCMFSPSPVKRYAEDIACGSFEPNA